MPLDPRRSEVWLGIACTWAAQPRISGPESPASGASLLLFLIRDSLVSGSPGDLVREELRHQIFVVGLDLGPARPLSALGVQIVRIELADPIKHSFIVRAHQVAIRAVPV